MKYKLYIYCSLLLALPMVFTGCKSDDVEDNSKNTNGISLNSNSTAVCQYADRLEFPHLSSNGTSKVLVNTSNDKFDSQGVNYSVEWDSNLRTQRWSCYQMHSGYSITGVSRFSPSDTSDPQYPFDSRLGTGYYTVDPFYGSGYDHGHMCPSADRLYSSYANWQTFFLTNMQPQSNNFNAGIWEKMESQIRKWTDSYESQNMYIVKGGTIDNQDYLVKNPDGTVKKIGQGLIVPRYYYVAILVKNQYGYKSIAFWFDQTAGIKSTEKLGNYAISVDKLEELTGLDFFCNLPDDIENDRECRCDLTAWGLQ